LASAHLLSKGLDLLLVDGTLGGLHQVYLRRLLEDLLGDLEGLVEVSLDESVGKLLPIGCCKNEFLEFLLVTGGNGCSALNSVLGKTSLGFLGGPLDNNLASLKEVLEGHGTILLVLRLTKLLTLLVECSNSFCGRLSTVKFCLLLGFFLRNNQSAEALELLVCFKVVMLGGLGEMC